MLRAIRIAAGFGAALLSIAAVNLFAAAFVNVPLTIVLLIICIATRSRGYLWAGILGLIYETFTPFPQFAYLGALLFTVFLLRLGMRQYVSGHSILGVVAVSFAGTLLFEVSLYALSALASTVSDGWVPTLEHTYGVFLLWRALLTTAVVSVIFAIVRQLSPRLRGVIVRTI